MFNKYIKVVCFIPIVVLATIGLTVRCTKTVDVPVEKIIYVPVKDTVSDRANIARIVELEHKCTLLQDSLNIVKDSLSEDLFVAKYKLGRIKYYTSIVDNKPSQIKFYKGWIKRVLKE